MNTSKQKSSGIELPTAFPEVPIRSSRNNINEKLIRWLVQCLADQKISRNDLCGITVKVANMFFDRKWKMHNNLDKDKNDAKLPNIR